MNFQQFLFTIVNEVQSGLEADCSLTVQSVLKNHTEKIKTVSIYRGNKRESPLIYMVPFYYMYKKGYPIQTIAKELNNILHMTTGEDIPREDIFLKFTAAATRLSIRLVSYERNKELLELVPHRRWMDLAVMYQLTFETKAGCIGSAIVFEQHRKLWGVTEDILFQTALTISAAQRPFSLMPLSMLCPGLPVPEENKREMYVLSNTATFFGASVLLYPGVLRDVYQRLQEKFYILPSSVHEVILLPYAPEYELSQLQEMVREINQTELQPYEILSDRVYQYDPQADQIELADS